MRKLAFLVGYGLLPLWASIAVVFIGRLFSHSLQYWAVAPWLVIASIPFCVATIVAATITLLVYVKVRGDESRKKNIAAKTFWTFNGLYAAAASAWWLSFVALERDIDNEKTAAQEFVRSHSNVVQQFGNNIEVNLVASTGNPGSQPLKYEISIDTKRSAGANSDSRSVFAIVSVKGISGQRQFVLDCITSLSMGKRDPFSDPCKQ